jgi:hypothetical protein
LLSRLSTVTGTGHRLDDAGQGVLGHRENDRNRAHLRDHHDAVGVIGMQDIAYIDQADAGAPGNRRTDRGVTEQHAGVVDGGGIALDGGFHLGDLCARRVELLARDVVLFDQAGVALQIQLGVGELRFVLCLLGQRLVQGGLVRARIDLGQDVARPHFLAFLEADLHQLAIHLRTESDRVVRLYVAQSLQEDRDVAAGGQCGRDRDGRRSRSAGCRCRRGLLALHHQDSRSRHRHQRQDRQQRPIFITHVRLSISPWRNAVDGSPSRCTLAPIKVAQARSNCIWHHQGLRAGKNNAKTVSGEHRPAGLTDGRGASTGVIHRVSCEPGQGFVDYTIFGRFVTRDGRI